MLEYMNLYDVTLTEKFKSYVVETNHKKSLGIVLRKFIQSLGFYLLSVDVCLYVWDQIILKTEPQKDEMFYYFIALMIAAKDELIQCVKFSDFVEVIYFKGKAVSKDLFVAKYIEMIPKMSYFIPRYDYDQVPVDDILLNKFPMDQRITNRIQRQIDGERNDLSLDEDEKKVKANMDQLIRDNVLNDSNEDFPEADGMLVDNSILNKINKPKKKNQSANDDILADMGTEKKSSKRSIGSKKDSKVVKSNRSVSKKESKRDVSSKKVKKTKQEKREPSRKKVKDEKKVKKERTASKGKSAKDKKPPRANSKKK